MVKFRQLVKKTRKVDSTDLVAVFESKDRHTSHTELRKAQEESLESLSERRDERDLILKVSTGTGKTTVGLVFLHSHMLEQQKPVVYLCPTVQLVEQVCDEASRIGMATVTYPGGQPHPPIEGTRGTAIIVCTYDKLFNGHSTFDRSDVQLRPCAMVLDDAHAGLDIIRDSFRLTYDASSSEFQSILNLLEAECSKQFAGRWDEIRDHDARTSIEIPYWTWKSVLPEIQPIIFTPREGTSNWFAWPFVRDGLRWSRCIVSGGGIDVLPLVLPVAKCRAFDHCGHRLFTSATLADDASLIQDLGCERNAVDKPIYPSADRGLGERMVIPPSLIDGKLNREWLAQTCKQLSRRYNVVVLSPSESAARTWVEAGAEFVRGEDVAEVVHRLRNEAPGDYVVFAQRYDGVDLPDDACRVLVLDGLPTGESIADIHDAALSGTMQSRIVHRIEQGMGRAVRSHVDYAVVILSGPELAHFIARSDVLSSMNPETQAQLKLAIDLSELAIEEDDEPEDACIGLIKQCLKRDAGWKDFYQENVRDIEFERTNQLGESPVMAIAVRDSFIAAIGNDASSGATRLQSSVNAEVADPKVRARFLQLVANCTYEFDTAKAMEIQRSAHSDDRNLMCPPMVAKRGKEHSGAKAVSVVARWFERFENPNGALAAIQELRSRLSYDGSAESVEQALLELAPLIGAEGSRPEKELGEGPDDLWLWPEFGIVIEAKNRNRKTLHKKDAGQLLGSIQWFENAYPTRGHALPVIVAKTRTADRKSDFPQDTRVLTPTKMSKLLEKIEEFYTQLVHDRLLASNSKRIAMALRDCGLTSEPFRASYTESLRQDPK